MRDAHVYIETAKRLREKAKDILGEAQFRARELVREAEWNEKRALEAKQEVS